MEIHFVLYFVFAQLRYLDDDPNVTPAPLIVSSTKTPPILTEQDENVPGLTENEKAELDAYVDSFISQRGEKIEKIYKNKIEKALVSIKQEFKRSLNTILGHVNKVLKKCNISYKENIISEISKMREKILSVVLDSSNKEIFNETATESNNIKNQIESIFQTATSDLETYLTKTNDNLQSTIKESFESIFNVFHENVTLVALDMEFEASEQLDLKFPNVKTMLESVIVEKNRSLETVFSYIMNMADEISKKIKKIVIFEAADPKYLLYNKKIHDLLENVTQSLDLFLGLKYNILSKTFETEIREPLNSYEEAMTERAFSMLASLAMDFRGILDEVVNDEVRQVIRKYY